MENTHTHTHCVHALENENHSTFGILFYFYIFSVRSFILHLHKHIRLNIKCYQQIFIFQLTHCVNKTIIYSSYIAVSISSLMPTFGKVVDISYNAIRLLIIFLHILHACIYTLNCISYIELSNCQELYSFFEISFVSQ